jgi:hypothetical protein
MGTVGTAEYLPSGLNAMPDDSTGAMSARVCCCSDGTFKTVKRVLFPTYDDVKAFVVLIPTGFAGRHKFLALASGGQTLGATFYTKVVRIEAGPVHREHPLPEN